MFSASSPRRISARRLPREEDGSLKITEVRAPDHTWRSQYFTEAQACDLTIHHLNQATNILRSKGALYATEYIYSVATDVQCAVQWLKLRSLPLPAWMTARAAWVTWACWEGMEPPHRQYYAARAALRAAGLQPPPDNASMTIAVRQANHDMLRRNREHRLYTVQLLRRIPHWSWEGR